jgi:hypothetical protein
MPRQPRISLLVLRDAHLGGKWVMLLGHAQLLNFFEELCKPAMAGAAAVAAPIGVPAVTAGTAGMAAILSTLSSAAGHGSAGAIIIAGSGLPPRSARGRPGDDSETNFTAPHACNSDHPKNWPRVGQARFKGSLLAV